MNMDVVIHLRRLRIEYRAVRDADWRKGGCGNGVSELKIMQMHSLQALSLRCGWGICLLNSPRAIPLKAFEKNDG